MTELRAADWNVNHGTTIREAHDTIATIMYHEPDIVLLQEINGKAESIPFLLRDEFGLRIRQGGEFAIGWNPKRFSYVRHSLPLMSQVEYWTLNRALITVLADKQTGRHIKVMSYHPPAHVQAPGHPSHEKVMAVHRDFAVKRNRIAARGDMPFLSAGDSNIDPLQGWAPKDGWDWMFGGPTLDYVRAPKPTHHSRHIDEFMVAGLQRQGKVKVLDNGPSDHHPLIAEFKVKR